MAATHRHHRNGCHLLADDGRVDEDVQHDRVQRKNKERQYNKLSEIDRFVRAGEFFTIDEDTLNDKLAAGYMSGINDRYAVYYTAKEYSEKQAIEKGTLTGIGVAVVNDASSGYARIIRVYNNSPRQ